MKIANPSQFKVVVVRVNESIPGPRTRNDYASIESTEKFTNLLGVLYSVAEEMEKGSKGLAILQKAASQGENQSKFEIVWLAAKKLRMKEIEVKYVKSVLAWWETKKPEKLVISITTYKTRRRHDRERERASGG